MAAEDDDYIDMRMLVSSGDDDDDGEHNLRPWLQIKDDNPSDPKPTPRSS